MKNHSRNLHAPLCGRFCPNSVAVARYGALIRTKSPTNCDAHLAESLFQTRSSVPTYFFILWIIIFGRKDCAFKKTARTIIKQLVSIRMVLDVTEYHADVYYNSQTGERAHAAFPEGAIDDVTYDGSIRAFLFLLNSNAGAVIFCIAF